MVSLFSSDINNDRLDWARGTQSIDPAQSFPTRPAPAERSWQVTAHRSDHDALYRQI